jgi:hypothetical protein
MDHKNFRHQRETDRRSDERRQKNSRHQSEIKKGVGGFGNRSRRQKDSINETRIVV